jgi:hypothetical protein
MLLEVIFTAMKIKHKFQRKNVGVIQDKLQKFESVFVFDFWDPSMDQDRHQQDLTGLKNIA